MSSVKPVPTWVERHNAFAGLAPAAARPQMMRDVPAYPRSCRTRSCRSGAGARIAPGCGALFGRDHRRNRGADRSRRSGRSDRGAIRAQRRRAERQPRGSIRPDRRRASFAAARHRPPLPGPGAAEADPGLPGLLPLLLPARAGRAGRGPAGARRARPRVCLHRITFRNLGGDRYRRRSVSAVAAPRRRDRPAARCDRACRGDPVSYPGAGRRAGTGRGRTGGGACGREGGLCRDPRQPSA